MVPLRWRRYWEHHNPNPTVNSKGVVKGNMLTGSPCPTRTHAWDFKGVQA